MNQNYGYRGYEIQIELVRGTLYAFVWPPGSALEWGSPAITAAAVEGEHALLRRVRGRIDEDIAGGKGARAPAPSRAGVRLRKGQKP